MRRSKNSSPRKPSSPGTHKGPLRLIVRVFPHPKYGTPEELLECGHVQLLRSDFIGQTNAVRRRCRKCKQGLPPDQPQESPS